MTMRDGVRGREGGVGRTGNDNAKDEGAQMEGTLGDEI